MPPWTGTATVVAPVRIATRSIPLGTIPSTTRKAGEPGPDSRSMTAASPRRCTSRREAHETATAPLACLSIRQMPLRAVGTIHTSGGWLPGRRRARQSGSCFPFASRICATSPGGGSGARRKTANGRCGSGPAPQGFGWSEVSEQPPSPEQAATPAMLKSKAAKSRLALTGLVNRGSSRRSAPPRDWWHSSCCFG